MLDTHSYLCFSVMVQLLLVYHNDFLSQSVDNLAAGLGPLIDSESKRALVPAIQALIPVKYHPEYIAKLTSIVSVFTVVAA